MQSAALGNGKSPQIMQGWREAHFGIELSGVRQVNISKHIARTDFHRFIASDSPAHLAPHNRPAPL
jgi:hypothetical protein